jgi:protein SCO1/2
MATSGLDSSRYLANVIENWLDPAWAGRPPRRSYADAPGIPRPTRGHALYVAQCAACHQPDGTSVGPDLAGVTARRDREWLTRWIKAPERLVVERDPVALELLEKHDQVLMPTLELSDADVAAVVEFLESRATLKAASAGSGK